MTRKLTILRIKMKNQRILEHKVVFHQEITMVLIENMKILGKNEALHPERTMDKVIINTQTLQAM